MSGEATRRQSPRRERQPRTSAVRDQPNSLVIGSTKMESVATAGPCRAKPAEHTHARITQP